MLIADSGSQQPPYSCRLYNEAERGNCDRRARDRLKRDGGRP